MLQLIGMILLLTGSTGMAWNYCQEQRERLRYLKYIKQMYEYLQNEIAYARSSLPEICEELSDRLPEPFAQAFAMIVAEIKENNGRSFEDIWTGVMTEQIKPLPLSGVEKELIIDLTDSPGFRDGKGQAKGMERHIEEVTRHIKELEEGLKSKNKVVMCMGVMGGLMAIILLI
ncbi:MAG: stage III sporulation protein AB [Lachnospiraceae bacterium]|jgi:stage III sporulation protein AB|nr:stage III sporulation protein AB [Lachnospiraceae bacterium]